MQTFTTGWRSGSASRRKNIGSHKGNPRQLGEYQWPWPHLLQCGRLVEAPEGLQCVDAEQRAWDAVDALCITYSNGPPDTQGQGKER